MRPVPSKGPPGTNGTNGTNGSTGPAGPAPAGSAGDQVRLVSTGVANAVSPDLVCTAAELATTYAPSAVLRGVIAYTSDTLLTYVCRRTAVSTYAWMALGAPAAAGSLGHSWERPSPTTAGPGATFIDSDTLSEQVSSGLAVSAGVAASGWMRRLASGLGAGRAGIAKLAGGAPQTRIYGTSLDLSAYTLDNVTVAALWTWDGTQPSSSNASWIVSLGDSNNALRGIHIIYVINGANTDLMAVTNGVGAVLIASVNLLPDAVGPHSFAIQPITGNLWRFSYDESAVADVAIGGGGYVAPSSSDALGFGARPDGVVWLNGNAVDLAIWNSQLSSANLLALATPPATPTYELPVSASTGVPTVRVQAALYDPATSPTTLRARGLAAALSVGTNTAKVTL